MIWISWNILCVDHAAALPRTHPRLMKSQKIYEKCEDYSIFSRVLRIPIAQTALSELLYTTLRQRLLEQNR